MDEETKILDAALRVVEATEVPEDHKDYSIHEDAVEVYMMLGSYQCDIESAKVALIRMRSEIEAYRNGEEGE